MQGRDPEEIEVRLFLEALHARYGYDLRDYAPASIRRRVLGTLSRSGCEHLGELQHRLIVDPQTLPWVLDCLTVQVSDMFRDPLMYRAFRGEVVPHLRGYPRIKIWHVGCAGGEEVYSTAIVLLEEGLLERAQIYATDLSPGALGRAAEAVYDDTRFEVFRRNYLEAGGVRRFTDYAALGHKRMALHERLRQAIHFFQHDLVNDHALGEMQMVFCRNVLMYLGGAARRRAFSVFRSALCSGGFLCLGAKEQVPREEAGFAGFASEACIYRHWERV